MSHTHLEITRHLLELVDRDELMLPTLPEVALRIREAANDPNVTSRDLTELLGTDPAISAWLIRIANSPLMRSFQRIDTLSGAISRLGIAYSCNLATGLAMEQLFQATSEAIDARMRHAWQHSTEVAAIATVLTRHYTSLKPDQATLAALVHAIGVLPVLAYAEEHSLFLGEEDGAQLDQLIATAHPLLGERILAAWNFPEDLLPVPVAHVDVRRVVERVDYVDVIIVAKLQCQGPYLGQNPGQNPGQSPGQSPGQCPGQCPGQQSQSFLPVEEWHTVSAFHRLGLSPIPDVLEAEGLGEQMHGNLSAWR